MNYSPLNKIIHEFKLTYKWGSGETHFSKVRKKKLEKSLLYTTVVITYSSKNYQWMLKVGVQVWWGISYLRSLKLSPHKLLITKGASVNNTVEKPGIYHFNQVSKLMSTIMGQHNITGLPTWSSGDILLLNVVVPPKTQCESNHKETDNSKLWRGIHKMTGL